MRKLKFAACALLFGMISCAQETTLGTRIDQYLSPFVLGRNFTGAVLVSEGDQVLYDKAYGQANWSLNVPNSTRTRFHIASISKPFTAAAILLLAQRGRLGLDDPVSKYVPDYPRGKEITLRHLLTHTSGIENVNDLPEYEAASRFHQTPRTLIDLFQGKPLNFDPGSRYEYSNSNYNVLAYIIEQAGGKPYGDFLRENIFVPLELRDTGHDGDAADVIPYIASGYQPRGVAELENAPYIDWSAKTGNGSLYSTTSDILRFLHAYRDGKLVPKSTADQLWTEKPGNNFGWFVRRSNGELVVSTNGRSPGFTSSAEYYPARRLAVVVLSNSYSPVSQTPIADDIAAMALGKPVSMPGRIVPVPIDPSQLQRFEGSYRFGPDFFRPNADVTLRIESGQPLLDWGNQFRTSLIPVGNGEFVDRQFWARIRMEQDGSGFVYSTSGRDFKVRKVSTLR
jgi:CubicO group peptidase (beta-lactamase class C family)